MKWLREPLVHFLALGAALFVVFSLIGGSDEDSSDQIVVSAAQIEIMAEGFARTWQRPPIAQEVTGLIDDYIRDEIYYREALAMGLDRDDTIIRRRLRQKMEFFTDDLQAAVVPGEEQLRAYLEADPEKFRVPARVSFEHIYLNTDQRGAKASSDAESLLTRLQEGGSGLELSALGDPLPLPREYVNAPADRVGGRFGGGFAQRLVELPVGTWSGPVESGFGLHLVLVTERQEGAIPPYEDIEDIIEREWRAEQRNTVKEAFYQTLRQRYSVVVEEPTFGEGEPGEVDGAEESR
jgi:hypothetical protein